MTETDREGLHPRYAEGADRISCEPVLETLLMRRAPTDDDLRRWLLQTYNPADFKTVGEVRVIAAALELFFRTGRGRYELAVFTGETLIANGARIKDWRSFVALRRKPVTVERLRLVTWCNLWNVIAANNGDGYGTKPHLTRMEGREGKTLCGKRYPREKGHPSTWGERLCKRCRTSAYRLGYEKGFERGLIYVP